MWWFHTRSEHRTYVARCPRRDGRSRRCTDTVVYKGRVSSAVTPGRTGAVITVALSASPSGTVTLGVPARRIALRLDWLFGRIDEFPVPEAP